jgi:hypothetical protein
MSFSQSLGYQDLGILFSQNDNNGSARFTAMSGAFGALGGDISAINVNPAGLSVFKNSMFSGSFNSKSSTIIASFGDANFNDRKKLTTNNEAINLSHAGAVLVFDSHYNSDWDKFAIGFNYRITKGFSDSFSAEGNEAIARFDTNPRDTGTPETLYNFTDGQLFNTSYGGEITELNFAFSAVHQKKIHVGVSLNFYSLNFSQRSVLKELNSDVDGNILDVELYQENFTSGSGFSANAGFIYKAHKSFRFGIAYQTPTWYSDILQDTNYNQDSTIDIGKTTFFPENQDAFSELNDLQSISYSLKTPSKLTASAAFIFGKNGLLSFDYINKNYQNTKLSNGVFTSENNYFQNDLKNTHNYNVGTEWRFDRFSVRGGYNFEQTPNTNNLVNTNSVLKFSDIEGYSFGGGYNFGNFKLDFAYSNNNRTSSYNFYNGFNIRPANLTLDNRIFTTSIILNL